MPDTPRDRLRKEFAKLDRLPGSTADRLREFGAALDDQKAPRTVEMYVANLRLMTERGCDPIEATPEAVNAHFDALHDDGDGMSANTLIGYQSSMRALYEHLDLGFDPDAIDMYTRDRTPRHDEEDLFTEDEVFAMRVACGRTRDPVRNRAFLELLIFTLQRVTALLTLRVENVDVEEGAIYLNADYAANYGGLKGATRRGRRRPVYGGRKYLRDWVRAHPAGEGWLFVGEPAHWNAGDGHWAPSAARDLLKRVADLAGVEKPVNPHNFRHYGVTVLRRDYDCSWDEINAQAGVVKGSNMPRTTYNHVDDTDLMRNIEERMGLADGEERNRFAPVACPICDEVLKSDWRKCPACGERFAPGEDDGAEDMEWLADKAALSTSAFKRAVSRAVDRELEERGHVESS